MVNKISHTYITRLHTEGLACGWRLECSPLSLVVVLAFLALPTLTFWTLSLPSQQALDENMDLLEGITGFEDSVRKCKPLSELGLPEGREWPQGRPAASLSLLSAVICHVVGITYQHIDRWLLAEMLGDLTGKALWVPSTILGGQGGRGHGPQRLLRRTHLCLTR